LTKGPCSFGEPVLNIDSPNKVRTDDAALPAAKTPTKKMRRQKAFCDIHDEGE
jgi:hypothetical protein